MTVHLLKIAALTLAAFLFAALPAEAAEADFVTGTGDLPLMAGLREVADGALVFEVAGGRIVEVAATGSLSAHAVRRFYGETLPQLGWTPAGSDRYLREGEVLVFDILSAGDGVEVRFTLGPRPAGK